MQRQRLLRPPASNMPGIRLWFQWPASGIVNVARGVNKAARGPYLARDVDFFARCGLANVARMKRSVIRVSLGVAAPDCAALHPGYASHSVFKPVPGLEDPPHDDEAGCEEGECHADAEAHADVGDFVEAPAE